MSSAIENGAAAAQRAFTTNPLMFVVALAMSLGVGSVVYQNWRLVDTMVANTIVAQEKTNTLFARMSTAILDWQTNIDKQILINIEQQSDILAQHQAVHFQLERIETRIGILAGEKRDRQRMGPR